MVRIATCDQRVNSPAPAAFPVPRAASPPRRYGAQFMKIRLIAATLLLLPVSVALFAQDGKQQHDGHRGDHARGGLERLDTDNDGRISRAEFDKGRAERDARMAQHAERAGRDDKRKHEAPDFTVLDTNKDGYVVRSEMRAYHDRIDRKSVV